MELKVYWTDFAQHELRNVFSYYKNKAGLQVARKLTLGIVKATLKLQKHPELGQIEPLLAHHDKEFRYLLFKNFKIIYRLNRDKQWIEINDVFDTRLNPVKIIRNL